MHNMHRKTSTWYSTKEHPSKHMHKSRNKSTCDLEVWSSTKVGVQHQAAVVSFPRSQESVAHPLIKMDSIRLQLIRNGAGAFDSVAEACKAAVEVGEITEPGQDAAVYDEVYRVYRDLYPALRDSFHRLSELDA